MKELEICCDASIKTYPNGRTLGCAGAIAVGLDIERTKIIPDATNNKSELMAMYLAVKLAHELRAIEPYDITIYSDSKFVVYGINVWMEKWLMTVDKNGVMYNYNNQPVVNQELFKMIISYMVSNNLKLKIRHQKGHVKLLSEKGLAIANKVFYESNGYRLDDTTLRRVSLYNDRIDKDTRAILQYTNPNDFSIDLNNNLDQICNYIIPYNYKEYVL